MQDSVLCIVVCCMIQFIFFDELELLSKFDTLDAPETGIWTNIRESCSLMIYLKASPRFEKSHNSATTWIVKEITSTNILQL